MVLFSYSRCPAEIVGMELLNLKHKAQQSNGDPYLLKPPLRAAFKVVER